MDDSEQLTKLNFPIIFNAQRRPIDILRGCQNGLTFYTMLGFDQKFKLLKGGGIDEEYNELIDFVKRLGIGHQIPTHPLFSYNEDTTNAINRLVKINFETLNETDINKVLF